MKRSFNASKTQGEITSFERSGEFQEKEHDGGNPRTLFVIFRKGLLAHVSSSEESPGAGGSRLVLALPMTPALAEIPPGGTKRTLQEKRPPALDDQKITPRWENDFFTHPPSLLFRGWQFSLNQA